MPSVKNPNAPSKNRLAARSAKARKSRQKAAALGQLASVGGKAAKADARRGARPGLLPTSGPRAPVSKKRARRDEKRIAHALKRKMEAEAREGEVVMKDAPADKTKGKGEKKTGEEKAEEEMDIE